MHAEEGLLAGDCKQVCPKRSCFRMLWWDKDLQGRLAVRMFVQSIKKGDCLLFGMGMWLTKHPVHGLQHCPEEQQWQRWSGTVRAEGFQCIGSRKQCSSYAQTGASKEEEEMLLWRIRDRMACGLG